MDNFNSFNLNEKTLKAIASVGFKKPTSIQEKALPAVLANFDLACKGKTGSGKTHCFLIPLANKIEEDNKNLQAIILVPTRELAIQTEKVCKEFFKSYDLKILCLTGGNDVNRSIDKLQETPQIVIGTPEKIDLLGIQSGLLNISTVKTFIVDEADMTLEMGFLNQIDRIASLLNKSQILLFSATIPAGLRQFIKKYFKNPLLIEDEKGNNNENIEHILYPLRGRNPKEVLLTILNNINPYICLIFLNTKVEVESYYEFLQNQDIDCEMIHGDLQARERKRNIKASLDGRYRFIVCSDIASRGIDIEGVSHVISIGFPKNNLEFYTHRAGRCGRNKLAGQCITIYNQQSDKDSILKLEEYGIKFHVKEIKSGEWKELKEVDARNKRKNVKHSQLDEEIQKVVRMHKTRKVKPNYKKKVKVAIEKVKRQHKRDIIQKDIKKRIKERAIAKNKGE